ncbi:flagellar hook-length control protein FliK [Sandaracinobacter neustonicus]|uniref:Flagellar hook-length control protein FliK n=1 Tax=Sandaracinobacter neustonicus TaxID=1715348 RepID=A0A501XIL8_9SPHN|nr:flagellar hook-length control protein FliK [Sandaracinobacter neustonicus]TPE60144.1 flagellar hook-length control protein FliK [Sandaracinobacter neustonicus]
MTAALDAPGAADLLLPAAGRAPPKGAHAAQQPRFELPGEAAPEGQRDAALFEALPPQSAPATDGDADNPATPNISPPAEPPATPLPPPPLAVAAQPLATDGGPDGAEADGTDAGIDAIETVANAVQLPDAPPSRTASHSTAASHTVAMPLSGGSPAASPEADSPPPPLPARSTPVAANAAQPAPQLPPLRMEAEAPHRPAAEPATATPATPTVASAAPATPAPPADIRISTPGEQALQVTIVAGSSDLRDRISAARPELRADLARVGAEVDLISVELRPAPGPSSAQANPSQQGSDGPGKQANGGGDASAMTSSSADFGTATDSGNAEPGSAGFGTGDFAAAIRHHSPADRPAHELPSDLSAEAGPAAPQSADPTAGTGPQDSRAQDGGAQADPRPDKPSDQSSARAQADGGRPGQHSRQPARLQDAQSGLRPPLPAPVIARAETRRIDRYA